MRVGVNTLFLIPGEVGGTETYLRESLRALARRTPPLPLVLFTQAENDGYWRDRLAGFPQVEFVPLRFRARNRVTRMAYEQFYLPAATRRAGVEVLWSPGYVAPWRAPCPQVVTIHDMQYRSYPEDLVWPARQAMHVLVTQAAARCQHILTPSEFSKQEVVRYAGVAPDKVTTVLEAVAPDYFEPSPACQALRRETLGFEDPYLLCVANTYPHKNVHRLIEAFDRLAAEAPCRLVLLGRPQRGEARVRAAWAASPVRDRIIRLERVGARELVALYQSASVFVSPSLYEGFGLPVLEAMAAGTPVAALRRAAVPEVGGDTIAYAERDDADELAACIRMLLRLDAGARAAWCARARERARTFSWDRCAATLAEALCGAGRRLG